MELDPEEEIMLMKLAELFWESIPYNHYYTPGDFFQATKFWMNLTRSVGVSRMINPRRFGYGNFEFDPQGQIYEVLHFLYSENPQKFREFLTEVARKMPLNENVELVTKLNRYLSPFGLQADPKLDIQELTMIGEVRIREKHEMFSMLDSFPNQKEAIAGAIERLSIGGTDAFRQCLDSCRNALEGLIKTITNESAWTTGLRRIISSETDQKLVGQVYAFLSARGIHGTSVPTEVDTILGLKLTEDLLMWILQKTRTS